MARGGGGAMFGGAGGMRYVSGAQMPWQKRQEEEYYKYGPGGKPQGPDFGNLMQMMPQMQQAMTMMGYSPDAMQALMSSYLKNPLASFLGAGSGFNMDKTAYMGSQGIGGSGLYGG